MKPEGSSGRLLPTIFWILGVGGLGLAHLEVMGRGPGYQGLLLPLDHLFALGLAAGLLIFCVGLGARLLAAVGLEPEAALESVLFSAATGAGAMALLFLILGAVGLLSGLSLALALLGVAAATRSELGRAKKAIRSVAEEVGERAGDRWLLAAALVAAGGAGAFLFLHGAAPPGDWDSLMYHLEIPRRWLAEGRIFLPEDSLHAAYVGPVQLLYLPLLAAGSATAPALLNGLFALLLALAVFAVGGRLLDGETGTFAALVLWASTGLLIVASTARIDTTLLFYLILGHGAVVLAGLEPSRSGKHLLRAGLVLGLAVGIKPHALAYTAALTPVGLWALWRSGDELRARAGALLPAAGGFVLAALPWIGLTVALVGAPFYPVFAERILPPWLAELYGSAAMPAGLDSGSLGALGQARERFDLVSFFLAPERITVEPEAVHYNVSFLLLLLPLWLFHLRRTALAALAVPALLYAAVVLLPFETTNLRYLFPALAPLTIATAYLAVELVRNAPRESVRRTLLLVTAGAVLLPTFRSAVAWTRKAPVVQHVAGGVSAQDYLAAGFPFYAGLVAGVNRNVPREGSVLLLWEARGFLLGPRHIQDNILSNWPLLAPYLERTGTCLEETEITHVMVSAGAVRYYASRGTSLERLGWERFQAFRDRCLERVDEGSGWTLYRVPPR